MNTTTEHRNEQKQSLMFLNSELSLAMLVSVLVLVFPFGVM
jgi:hypothetical protein